MITLILVLARALVDSDALMNPTLNKVALALVAVEFAAYIVVALLL